MPINIILTLPWRCHQLLLLLVETDRVYEKSKSRLRLSELGLYPGLCSLLSHAPVSLHMVRYMLTQVFLTGTGFSQFFKNNILILIL